MFVLIETGVELQDGDEVFICDDDYVCWEDAVKYYRASKVYDEENMMPVRRKISEQGETEKPTANNGNTPCRFFSRENIPDGDNSHFTSVPWCNHAPSQRAVP